MSAFEKIIGYENLKSELKMIADLLQHPKKYEALGVKPTHGLLLHGDPGVGKTTIAKAFVEFLDRKTYILRKNKPDGKFLLEITNTFEEAKKNTPCVVLLDDMDKYANEDDNHKNAEEYVTVQSCIDNVKDFDVFVIATVNNKRSLPKSLKRPGRFDNIIEVNVLDGKDAELIVKYYLSSKTFISDIDSTLIARLLEGRSCATLESIINFAGIYAGYQGRDNICMDDIITAYMREVYDTPIEKHTDDKEKLLRIATHEAGHAVLAEILNPGSVDLVSVRGGKSDKGGFCSITKPDNYWYSKEEMENRVISILGGKAATDLAFGVIDPGASEDLERAFRLVERFVDNYCGFDFNSRVREPRFSSKSDHPGVSERRDQYMAAEMSRYYEMAKRFLAQNRSFLDAIINLLVKEITVTGDRIRELREKSDV